jgi:hypothetical protein
VRFFEPAIAFVSTSSTSFLNHPRCDPNAGRIGIDECRDTSGYKEPIRLFTALVIVALAAVSVEELGHARRTAIRDHSISAVELFKAVVPGGF